METVTIEIDGTQYEVQPGGNLLATCLGLGLDLPYFCWHPAMGSVGACRQCAVTQYKDEEDTEGRLVMACMTPVSDGMRISLQADMARQFRAENIELLMINHPHDCPVCEEGGECHLQDMTVMSGHTFRRYRGLKRTHRNQYLGPFINHEMNRCIACYRCVRFYRDYAGGRDLQAQGMANNVYFGRHEEGTLENEFSGNLVEVCPTGVFTDKPFSERYTRKWDLQTAPSICIHCGLGCNITPGERYGELRRIVNRYHGEINGYFLCDRGRFGYGFVNSEQRLREPQWQGEAVSSEGARTHFKQLLRDARRIIGVGSPRASLEANFALRMLVGEDNFHLGLAEREHKLLTLIADIQQRSGIRTPTLREVEQADAVLVLGEDVTQSAPRLALALRQSIRTAALAQADSMKVPRWQDGAVRELEPDYRSPLHIASPAATRLDDVAAATSRVAPDDIARLGFAVAHCLNGNAPAVSELDDETRQRAETIAADLRAAQRPLIVAGTASGSQAVIQAAFNIAKALSSERKGLLYTVPECNSLGLALMGGKPLAEARQAVERGEADTLVILENDLYRRAPADEVDALLTRTAHVVVLDSLHNATTARAELMLPAAAFAETAGTLVNYEARAQRYFPAMVPSHAAQASWRWLPQSLEAEEWQHLDPLTAACAETLPVFAAIVDAAPSAGFRDKGLQVPRQPHRYSGRTAMHANIIVSESQPPRDEDSPLAYSMEGTRRGVPSALVSGVWAPGWNSNHAINKFQEEIGGPLQGGDPGVRLLDEQRAGPEQAVLDWFTGIPQPFQPKSGVWCLVSLPQIFGSEELSRQAAPIMERMESTALMLNPQDAEALQVAEGNRVAVSIDSDDLEADWPVRLDAGLARGVAAIPQAVSDRLSLNAPVMVRLHRADTSTSHDAPDGEGN